MYCKLCGLQLEDNVNICPRCGEVQDPSKQSESTANGQPLYEPLYTQASEKNEEKDALAGSALTWAILSLAFSASGCLALLGFIFSFIAKGKVNTYISLYGQTEGKTSVAKGLAKAGFIVGLIMTIYMTLCFFIGVIAGLMSALL